MSTDRGWSSCKNLGTKTIYGKHENTVGSNSKYIQDEVFNLLIAYLIKPEDRNIKNPIARINLVPYLNNKGQVGYIIDRGGDKYGFSGVLANVFVETAQKWLDSKQGKLLGKYVINPFVYRDTLEKEYNLKDTLQLPDWVEESGNIPKDFSYDKPYSDVFIWKAGTWEDGIWETGIWEYGTWENGVWKKGIWKYGAWKDGVWEDGVWESGTWLGGIWKNGFWKTGTWKVGVWEEGTWEAGKWENGIWKNGVWEKGTWKNGIWKDGIWQGGTWESGTWKTGWILDKEKKGNFKPEWEWNGVYIVSPISPREYFK